MCDTVDNQQECKMRRIEHGRGVEGVAAGCLAGAVFGMCCLCAPFAASAVDAVWDVAKPSGSTWTTAAN